MSILKMEHVIVSTARRESLYSLSIGYDLRFSHSIIPTRHGNDGDVVQGAGSPGVTSMADEFSLWAAGIRNGIVISAALYSY